MLELPLFDDSHAPVQLIQTLVLCIVGSLCLFDVLVDDVQHLVQRNRCRARTAQDANNPNQSFFFSHVPSLIRVRPFVLMIFG